MNKKKLSTKRRTAPSPILLPRSTAKTFPALVRPTYAQNIFINPPLVNIFLTTPIALFTTATKNFLFSREVALLFTFLLLKQLSLNLSSSFEGYPLHVKHKQDWGRGFILLLPLTAALPGSDAGSDVIKPASSFVIQNRQTSCSMWCPMDAVSTWSVVCSEAPHSQFGEGARPHLCMDEWNRPTPVRRRLSLNQATRGKPIPTSLALVSGTKARRQAGHGARS